MVETVIGLIASVVGIGWIVRQGFRNGDQHGDALTATGLVRVAAPVGPRLLAQVRIENQNDSAVVVSARARYVSPLLLPITGTRVVRPGGWSSRRASRDGVGAEVPGRGSPVRLVEIEGVPRGAVMVTLVLDQVEQRTRIVTSAHRVRLARVRFEARASTPRSGPRTTPVAVQLPKPSR